MSCIYFQTPLHLFQECLLQIVNFAKNVEIFIANRYCLLNSWNFQETPFLWYHYVYMHSLFYSPRHCKRRSGSILNLLMFYNLIKSAVLPKSICDMSFYYEQVWRVRNWGFDIDFKVTSFRLNSDIFKSQGLGCRILKFFVICPQGPKWLKWVVLSVLVYCIKNTHWKSC